MLRRKNYQGSSFKLVVKEIRRNMHHLTLRDVRESLNTEKIVPFLKKLFSYEYVNIEALIITSMKVKVTVSKRKKCSENVTE